MTQAEVLSIFAESLIIAIKMSSPMLIVSIVIGLIVSVFQAATQIQEQTLTFVPKLLAISLLLFVLGSYMLTILSEFMVYIFSLAALI